LASGEYARVSFSSTKFFRGDSTVQPKPAVTPRKTPHDEFVRKGSSPHWFCFVVECLQCGKFFRLKWPSGVDHFEETDVVHIECPSCLFEFAKMGMTIALALFFPSGTVSAQFQRNDKATN